MQFEGVRGQRDGSPPSDLGGVPGRSYRLTVTLPSAQWI